MSEMTLYERMFFSALGCVKQAMANPGVAYPKNAGPRSQTVKFENGQFELTNCEVDIIEEGTPLAIDVVVAAMVRGQFNQAKKMVEEWMK